MHKNKGLIRLGLVLGVQVTWDSSRVSNREITYFAFFVLTKQGMSEPHSAEHEVP